MGQEDSWRLVQRGMASKKLDDEEDLPFLPRDGSGDSNLPVFPDSSRYTVCGYRCICIVVLHFQLCTRLALA